MRSGTQRPGSDGEAGPAEHAAKSNPLALVKRLLTDYCAQYDHDDVVRVPDAASLDLVQALAVSVERTLRQIVPVGFGARPEDSFMRSVCRDIVSRKRTVERIYVMVSGGAVGEPVGDQLDQDRRAGLGSRLLPAAQTPVDLPLRNTWLVDDRLLVHEDFSDDGSPVWTVDSRAEAVRRSRSIWTQLWEGGASGGTGDAGDTAEQGDAADQPAGVPTGVSRDPVLVSADQLSAMALISCPVTPDDPETCAWYHGVWQYLRILNMVPEPASHDDFFAASIGEALLRHRGSAAPRALISGAADYALLGETLRAIGAVAEHTARTARVAVLDRCPTPLMACRWYARQTNTVVDTYEMDIRDAPARLGADQPYDVIASDSFLTKFSASDAADVLKAWRDLLVPGGRVVTTVRLRSTEAANEDEVPVDDVLDFVSRARTRAERWRWLLRASVDEIARGAEQYARRTRSTNLGSSTAILRMFKDAGFTVQSATHHRMPGPVRPTTYLRIVAEAVEGDTPTAEYAEL